MHSHSHAENRSLSTLQLAFFLNAGFTLVEIVGGFLTGSVAILADAVHDLGDSLALGLAWWLESLSKRKGADSNFTYGYGRLSLLAALVNALILTAGSTLILFHSIPRFFTPQPPQAAGMIVLAVFGLIVNGYAAWRTSKGATMNEGVVSWHLLEDVLGWLAVLIGGVIILFTKWWWIDPLLAIGIAAFVFFNIIRKLWKIARLFLQVVPEAIDVEAIRGAIEELDAVAGTHHFHVWSVDGESHVASIHVGLEKHSDPILVKRGIREIFEPYCFQHVTIELEFENDDCSLKDKYHSS